MGMPVNDDSLPQPPVALLLAAGAASRFGGGKLLHPLDDGVAIAAHAARHLAAAGLQVTAVLRPGDDVLGELLLQEGCRVSVCADAAKGMGHSLAHGVQQTASAGGWIVALADMPRVKTETIGRIARELIAGAEIVVPVYQGDRGHPVGFGRRFLDELRMLSGDSGARALVQRNQALVKRVDCDDPGILFDIDRRSDLEFQYR
jgi:molybdenum cofactor cytidylyltransferase